MTVIDSVWFMLQESNRTDLLTHIYGQHDRCVGRMISQGMPKHMQRIFGAKAPEALVTTKRGRRLDTLPQRNLEVRSKSNSTAKPLNK